MLGQPTKARRLDAVSGVLQAGHGAQAKPFSFSEPQGSCVFRNMCSLDHCWGKVGSSRRERRGC